MGIYLEIPKVNLFYDSFAVVTFFKIPQHDFGQTFRILENDLVVAVRNKEDINL